MKIGQYCQRQRDFLGGFFPRSWDLGDFDVQSWDFYCRELSKKNLSVILTSDDLRPQIYNDQTNGIVTF